MATLLPTQVCTHLSESLLSAPLGRNPGVALLDLLVILGGEALGGGWEGREGGLGGLRTGSFDLQNQSSTRSRGEWGSLEPMNLDEETLMLAVTNRSQHFSPLGT